jgi:hypothetical protein
MEYGMFFVSIAKDWPRKLGRKQEIGKLKIIYFKNIQIH